MLLQNDYPCGQEEGSVCHHRSWRRAGGGCMTRSVGVSQDDLHPVQLALAGSTGGVAYWALFFPADTVKSRLQTEQTIRIANPASASSAASATASPAATVVAPKSTFSSVFRDMYRTGGLRALYAGMGVTVARAVPSNFVTFFAYEAVMRRLKPL
jgi:ornithine carrier protein